MKTKVILFLLLAAAAVSAAVLLLRGGGEDSPVARITRDGVLLEEIDLNEVGRPYTLTFEDENGAASGYRRPTAPTGSASIRAGSPTAPYPSSACPTG